MTFILLHVTAVYKCICWGTINYSFVVKMQPFETVKIQDIVALSIMHKSLGSMYICKYISHARAIFAKCM